METLLANAYTRLDEKSKLLETSSIAIGTKELLQKKIYVKNIFYRPLYILPFWEKNSDLYGYALLC